MQIVKKDFHRTNLKRLIHTLCLLLPIACAFLGYFLCEPIFSILLQKKTTELMKFLCSVIFFAIPSILIFIFTRKENPIMKIGIFSD